ncbi:EAL domain-containing protein [Cellulomonas sp. SG140]|uniref:EAL domain-containing protein n=1 Tax=Cellulomonas sp. SG140 TaxID=2976536 RepID=UPI0021E7C5CB|nr:EAL domain-containing protein [Cellulomonas sp. SG140]
MTAQVHRVRGGGGAPTSVPTQRLPVALQPIWATNGVLLGHEYLYRSISGRPAGVDSWAAARQDEASASVLRTVFGDGGVAAGSALAFVNVTRSFLVRDRPLPAPCGRLVLEVVETVPAHAGVLLGLRRLRARGYRIAVDDYTASTDQRAMLPYADFVKVDCRDLARLPGEALEEARRYGARLVAEHVCDVEVLVRALELGFEFLQGDALGAATTQAC